MILVRNTLEGWAQRPMNVKITAFQKMELVPRFLKGGFHLQAYHFQKASAPKAGLHSRGNREDEC